MIDIKDMLARLAAGDQLVHDLYGGLRVATPELDLGWNSKRMWRTRNHPIQGFIADIEAEIARTISIDQALLTTPVSSTGSEMSLTYESVKAMVVEVELELKTKQDAAMHRLLAYKITGYDLEYTRSGRSVVKLRGSNQLFSSVLIDLKGHRFSSSRRARVWAKAQIGTKRETPKIDWKLDPEPVTSFMINDSYVFDVASRFPLLRDQAVVRFSSL
jgi:hypothetical protein